MGKGKGKERQWEWERQKKRSTGLIYLMSMSYSLLPSCYQLEGFAWQEDEENLAADCNWHASLNFITVQLYCSGRGAGRGAAAAAAEAAGWTKGGDGLIYISQLNGCLCEREKEKEREREMVEESSLRSLSSNGTAAGNWSKTASAIP